jgi:ribonuclease HI
VEIVNPPIIDTVLCHCLWTWRNKEMHDEEFVRPARPVHHIMQLAGDYIKAISNSNVVALRNQTVMMVGWSPPKPMYLIINTDGAYKVNQVAGCGGVIRGSHGEWIGGFAKNVGLCSAFVAELWGVLEGLRYIHRLGFNKVELSLDSEAVVRVIQNRRSASSLGSSVMKQIWRLMDVDWSVEVSHSHREANKCADVMANIGCSLNYDVVFYDNCPSQLAEIYAADLMGITTPRLISL